MAPKFEEGTRWDPAYGQHHGPKLCGGHPLGTRIRTTSWTQNLWREPVGNPRKDNVMDPKLVEGTRREPA